MPYLHEASKGPYETETITPDRPPQLNRTVCGCRCGRGQTGQIVDEAGGRNDGDDAEHLASPNAVVDETSGGEREESSLRELQEMETRLRDFLVGVDTLQTREGTSLILLDPYAFEGSVNSMNVEPYGSDDYSVISSGVRSLRSMSPGPGIGAWIEEANMNLGARSYHFRGTPLRLTPQRRFCRGLVASHLVLHDA
ncbi:hypothetical protein K491DRAFT_815 [Lophiostoma macrostomum CBS 122681]|uniref:Uncharacterized protein n=1 Tax=Lophiostoma macrostomum CBS 122681 TaxID=1314788 RepID=A0A6A6TRR0_9PLEO|nr:hypothetical protein K491DRAFT_815 [Lophiostoma macrostomum CBS 122681]